jgi:hypothetical protein
MKQLAGYTILGCLLFYLLVTTPEPPKTYRLEVCRDKNGDVLSEKMLDKDANPPYITKGCQVEVRDFKPN